MAPKHKPIVHWRQLTAGPLMDESISGRHRMMLEAAICANIDGCESCVRTSVERIAAETDVMIAMRRYVTVLATGAVVPFGSHDEAADIESGSVADRESTVEAVIAVVTDMFVRAHAHHSSEPEPAPSQRRVPRPGQRQRRRGGHVH